MAVFHSLYCQRQEYISIIIYCQYESCAKNCLLKSKQNFQYNGVELLFSVAFIYFNDMVAKSVGDDTNYKQLLVLPFDN